jgi:hypothetical protein
MTIPTHLWAELLPEETAAYDSWLRAWHRHSAAQRDFGER